MEDVKDEQDEDGVFIAFPLPQFATIVLEREFDHQTKEVIFDNEGEIRHNFTLSDQDMQIEMIRDQLFNDNTLENVKYEVDEHINLEQEDIIKNMEKQKHVLTERRTKKMRGKKEQEKKKKKNSVLNPDFQKQLIENGKLLQSQLTSLILSDVFLQQGNTKGSQKKINKKQREQNMVDQLMMYSSALQAQLEHIYYSLEVNQLDHAMVTSTTHESEKNAQLKRDSAYCNLHQERKSANNSQYGEKKRSQNVAAAASKSRQEYTSSSDDLDLDQTQIRLLNCRLYI